MKVEDLARLEGFELVVPGGADITGVYCCDLMSWAMAKAPEASAWCTVMGNVNAVAVASNADVAVLVLCEGAALDEDAAQRAQQHGVAVARTPLPAFQAALVIARAAALPLP